MGGIDKDDGVYVFDEISSRIDDSTVDVAKRGPTMADVARVAGVSAQTVSRVANGESGVRAKTRERVVEAMRHIGYRPNGAARALKRGRFNSVGIITFTLSSYGNIRTVDSLSSALMRRGFSVNLIVAPDRTEQSISGAFNRLADEAVDAIILLFEAGLIDSAQAEFPPGLPVLIIGSTGHELKLPTVDVDQEQGATLATEHLVQLGHRNIWHVRGPKTEFAASRREDAWRAVMLANGLDDRRIIPGDWTAKSGYAAGRLLANRDDVTAVFTANDSMALGLIRALRENGKDVPGDVSIVGFDNIADSEYLWPPLTTIDQDFSIVGDVAASMVLSAVANGDLVPRQEVVSTQLIVRQSTTVPKI
ncbi:LacI family DNA-binding transcriptional regulator [Raineyella sp.]|uniref:Lactose operon repressor n=1 Tax=bioreactor metagenome TaxID=1076179 RepID=A0A644X850_9ZZZZ|nr:LacI family DNA-binding transcriptional regulator [Raineyella sp.]MEA5154810.1 LacI family DNA-binding transcriptional regulator [Raineyella sp.]